MDPLRLLTDVPARVVRFLGRLLQEPPFRVIVRPIVKVAPVSARTKAAWDAVDRPHYLTGVLRAADEARREGTAEIAVIEFGVAGGEGLLALEACAAAAERETGVRIKVFGFDTGVGIPEATGDYRDHPDQWVTGDYPMNERALRARLSDRTTLILGDVATTVSQFLRSNATKIGFVAVDVDLYSSTCEALKIFTGPGRKMLRRVPMYFDDIDFFFNHRFAGELLAIQEFNTGNDKVRIDRWRGIAKGRAFPESPWLEKMFVAHDLEALSTGNSRPVARLDLPQ